MSWPALAASAGSAAPAREEWEANVALLIIFDGRKSGHLFDGSSTGSSTGAISRKPLATHTQYNSLKFEQSITCCCHCCRCSSGQPRLVKLVTSWPAFKINTYTVTKVADIEAVQTSWRHTAIELSEQTSGLFVVAKRPTANSPLEAI